MSISGEERIVDYSTVIDCLRQWSGRRVAVRVGNLEPSVTLAEIVGVLKSATPQRSIDSGDIEDGVVLAVETDRNLPDASFTLWQHPAGVGAKSDISVGWRAGSVVIMVDLLATAYGYPPG